MSAHGSSLAGQLEQAGDKALGDLGGQLQACCIRLPYKAFPVDGPLLAGHQVAQIELQVAAILLPAYYTIPSKRLLDIISQAINYVFK